jgi:CheY-like chemotaxis protein
MKANSEMNIEYNWSDKQILIVDDLELNRLLLKLILEPTNIKIKFAENISQFNELITSSQPFNLILMDVFLGDPDITGIDLIRTIKSKGINTPVIILTAYDNEDIHLDIIVDGFIKKPFKSKLLLKAIGENLT